jgi:hypothetical protein
MQTFLEFEKPVQHIIEQIAKLQGSGGRAKWM